MSNRKRANSSKKTTKPKTVKKEAVKKLDSIYDMFPARTLNQDDGNRMKELFTLSNNVSALIRDYAEKEITVKKMKEAAKRIEKEKQPLMVQVANNLFKTETNYKKLADSIKKQAEQLEKSLVIIKGQISHRYEDYVSVLIRQKRLLENIINNAQLKSITGHRSDAKTKAQEEKIFEKEFDKITDEDREQLKKLLEDRKNKTKKSE